jgi:hypothetical protein
MENKVLIISAIITLVGVMFTPTPKRKSADQKIEQDKVRIEAEQILEELKYENTHKVELCLDSLTYYKEHPKVVKVVKVIRDTVIIKDSIW